MSAADVASLHLLSIDLGSAPSGLRQVLELDPGDVPNLLEHAKRAAVPLAIVCGPGTVDLYSSHDDRRTAFKPLLERLWSLGRHLDGFERVRTTEASGHSVVRHLLRQAAGLESTEHGVSFVGAITRACVQAASHSTLSAALSDLFEVATATAHRARSETELQAPHSTRASRQVEALSAERILEEELTAFRAAAANDEATRRSTPPLRKTQPLSTFPVSEPESAMRLRVAPFSLAPVTVRRLG
jgi:Glutamyl-tRNAGlu reductase, N-terminal domain